jgi:hypothetical protein
MDDYSVTGRSEGLYARFFPFRPVGRASNLLSLLESDFLDFKTLFSFHRPDISVQPIYLQQGGTK